MLTGWHPSGPGGPRVETLGAQLASSGLTPLTSGAAVPGAWVPLGTTSFEWQWLNVQVTDQDTSQHLVDLGLDRGAAGVEVIATSLPLFHRGLTETGLQLAWPLRVPKAAALVARTTAAASAATVQCGVTGFSAGLRGMPGFQRAVQLHTGSGTFYGTALDVATANTKGSWTQLVAAAPARCQAVFGVIDRLGDNSVAAVQKWLLDVGIGTGPQIILPDLAFCCGTVADTPSPFAFGPFPCDIPAGVAVQARIATNNVATAGDRKLGLSLWGFVP